MSFTSLPPLSLYVHFPWCVEKCPYCDFNSHKVKNAIPESDYIARLLADLEQDLPSIWGRSLTSIFIGGGTPSLMSATGMDTLLSSIRARLPFMADTEVTMEANPGTAEAEKFKGFFQAGVNRLSIGVQSFNDRHLKALGRIHSADEALLAYQMARDAGFENVNLDLMYALPNQSIEQALSDLQTATSLAPEHLSWYQLTLEPNTAFHHTPPKNMANDDLRADISEAGLAYLKTKGYRRYEISAFSKNGNFNSWHNTNYWQFGDYLGIGAGAHGKITRADTQTITRTTKKRNPKDYLAPNKPLISESKQVDPAELPLEFMMNALRLIDGVEAQSFFARTGLLLESIQTNLQACRQKEILLENPERIAPTERGINYLNSILEYFTPDQFEKRCEKTRINIKELT